MDNRRHRPARATDRQIAHHLAQQRAEARGNVVPLRWWADAEPLPPRRRLSPRAQNIMLVAIAVAGLALLALQLAGCDDGRDPLPAATAMCPQASAIRDCHVDDAAGLSVVECNLLDGDPITDCYVLFTGIEIAHCTAVCP